MKISTIIMLLSFVPIFFMFGLGGSPDDDQTLEREQNIDPVMAKFGIPPSIEAVFSKSSTQQGRQGQLNVRNPLVSTVHMKFGSRSMYAPHILFDRDNDMVKVEPGEQKTVYFTILTEEGTPAKEFKRDIEIVVIQEEEDRDYKVLKEYIVPAYIELTE